MPCESPQSCDWLRLPYPNGAEVFGQGTDAQGKGVSRIEAACEIGGARPDIGSGDEVRKKWHVECGLNRVDIKWLASCSLKIAFE